MLDQAPEEVCQALVLVSRNNLVILRDAVPETYMSYAYVVVVYYRNQSGIFECVLIFVRMKMI